MQSVESKSGLDCPRLLIVLVMNAIQMSSEYRNIHGDWWIRNRFCFSAISELHRVQEIDIRISDQAVVLARCLY